MFRHRTLMAWARGLHLRDTPKSPFARVFVRSKSSHASRIDRITSRLPRRLQKYTTRLRHAPLSHVVSFLILHEITAVVPLFALLAVFHYTTYVPVAYIMDNFGQYVESGTLRFERYFTRKGWFGFGEGATDTLLRHDRDSQDQSQAQDAVERWHRGDKRYGILVEVALAYAVTKALLPVRIVASVWATPWFAGVLTKIQRIFKSKT